MLHGCRWPILLLLLTSCQPRPSAPVRLVAPPINTRATHYRGTALSGPVPTAGGTADLGAGSWIAQVEWVALSKWPTVASVPLSARSTLLLAGRSSAPLLGSPKLTADVRLVEEPEAGRLRQAVLHEGPADAARLGAFCSALPPNVTAVFDADLPSPGADIPARLLELRLATENTAPSPAPVFHNAVAVRLQSDSSASLADRQQTETAFFDQSPPGPRAGFALLLRLPSSVPGGLILAALVDTRPATRSPADTAAVAQGVADLQQSAAALTGQSNVFPLGISVPAGVASALQSLSDPSEQRASLTYLADQGDASLCMDVSLAADNATLADLAGRVQRWAKPHQVVNADSSPAALGWALDHAALELLTTLADSPEGGKLTPELAVVLTQFCGEAARHTAALDEIAHGVTGEADLQNRVVAQNLLFLTDPSPAARVRAFDWLNSRHLAPAGFDPLGTARQRRQAMDRATSQP